MRGKEEMTAADGRKVVRGIRQDAEQLKPAVNLFRAGRLLYHLGYVNAGVRVVHPETEAGWSIEVMPICLL